RTWQVALPSFGEVVDYRRRAKSKLDARWQEGVYLGLRLSSSEKIIGTPSGILVVQSIRRKPEDKQFSLELLMAVIGTPWQPTPEGVSAANADVLPDPIPMEPLSRLAQPSVREENARASSGINHRRDLSDPGGAEAEEKKRKAAKEATPLEAEPTTERSQPSRTESKKPAASASEAAPAQKRKTSDAEGMIEHIVQEREAHLKSLEGVEQPTCDLEDGLVEELLAETFHDDLTLRVKAARTEEISVIQQMGVWEVIPRPVGEKVIGTRWVDIDKGEEILFTRPEYLDRLFRGYAATISSLRALFSLATTKRVPKDKGKLSTVGSGGETCLMFLDVKKAHCWSPVRRRLLVELPPEANAGPNMVGLLKRSLYGTRDAPSKWEKAIKDALEGLGFRQGRSNPCLYFHGDDFTVVGSYEELKWLELNQVWTVETTGILARPGSELPGVIQSISVLNRLVTWTRDGIELEANPRHVDLVLEQLGLDKGAVVTTPTRWCG
ncbi:unnamed protein product, partial [Symbiodinium necroappetens]